WGTGNPAIALTYTSFAEITKPVTYAGRASTGTYYIPFGGVTPTFQVPTTGSATYSGVVYGKGGGGTFSDGTNLSGTSTFNVNFGTGSASIIMALIATDGANPAVNLGNLTYSGTFGAGCPGCGPANRYYLNLSDPNAIGILHGFFFGPNAAEYGAVFNINYLSGANNGAVFNGVTVGKKN
ncbi:MAG: transferrin-binding protein-like solute binding protein, partial [Sphingomonadaceae bacterium]|nr:transferrin-binding protein-like solute binding protein [Sphingomonadaceae bacterium]